MIKHLYISYYHKSAILNKSLIILLIFSLGSFFLIGCQPNNADSNNPSDEHTDPAAGCTLDDAIGEHNPKMIAIWGGKQTQDEWYIRNWQGFPRVSYAYLGLEFFFGWKGRFPDTWNELEGSGFFPIRPVDPFTGQSIIYGVTPIYDKDFLNVGVFASPTKWIFSFKIPDGSEIWGQGQQIYEVPVIDRFQIQRFNSNYIAIKGELLAAYLNRILNNYRTRRNEMPLHATALLDGIWAVEQDWAINNQSLDYTEDGGFLFGIDKSREVAVALWRDHQGIVYSNTYDYSPWPESGWDHVPNFEETAYLQNTYGYGNKLYGTTFNPVTFIPKCVLWKCSLSSEDSGDTNGLSDGVSAGENSK